MRPFMGHDQSHLPCPPRNTFGYGYSASRVKTGIYTSSPSAGPNADLPGSVRRQNFSLQRALISSTHDYSSHLLGGRSQVALESKHWPNLQPVFGRDTILINSILICSEPSCRPDYHVEKIIKSQRGSDFICAVPPHSNRYSCSRFWPVTHCIGRRLIGLIAILNMHSGLVFHRPRYLRV